MDIQILLENYWGYSLPIFLVSLACQLLAWKKGQKKNKDAAKFTRYVFVMFALTPITVVTAFWFSLVGLKKLGL